MATPADTAARRPGPALARAVALLHAAIVAFFALGWLAPWPAVHWAVLAGGAAMQACWCALADNCPLTVLERRLAGAPAADGQPDLFVSRMLSELLGRPVSDRAGNLVTYLVLYTSMLLCAGRLL